MGNARPHRTPLSSGLRLPARRRPSACSGSPSTPAAARATRRLLRPSRRPSSMPLKVMEFNIEYGGTQVSFAKVVEAVKQAQPDVIGLEEAETNTGRLARAAGYPYWSNAMQVVSRYPLLEPPETKGAYLYVQVQPGRCVALANVHLPSDDPGPQAIRRGAPVEKVLAAEEKVRLPYIQTELEVLPPLAEAGHPDLPGRRLQRAVLARLHGRGGRHARLREVRRRVAGEQGGRGGRVHRLVARRVPRPARGAWGSRGGRHVPRWTDGTRAGTRRRTASTSSTRPVRRRRRPPSSPASRAAPK